MSLGGHHLARWFKVPIYSLENKVPGNIAYFFPFKPFQNHGIIRVFLNDFKEARGWPGV